MATWVRNLSGAGPSATDANVSGTAELTNATAPGDFDPDAVNSVRIQVTVAVTAGSFSDDSQTVHFAVDLTLNGVGSVLAQINGADGTLNSGTSSVSTDVTDSTIPAGFSIAAWEGAELNPTSGFNWTTYNKTKGGDGVTVAVTSVTVTIDYNPATGQVVPVGAATEAETVNPLGGVKASPLAAAVEYESGVGSVAMDGAGDYISTGDDPSFDITGDIELGVCLNFANAAAAQFENLIARYADASATRRHFTLAKDASVTYLTLRWYDSGSVGHSQDSNPSLVSTSDRWYKVTLDVDNGSSQHVVTFYYSDDPPTTPRGSVSWTLHSQHVIGGTTSIQGAGIDGITFGERQDEPGEAFEGSFYLGWVADGIAGSDVVSPDYRNSDIIIDGQGNTWTKVGDAVWVGGGGGSQPLTPFKTVSVGVGTETESAQVIDHPGGQTVPVAATSETETPPAVAASKTSPVGAPTETETVHPLAASKTSPISPSTETEVSQAFSGAKTTLIAPSSETESASLVAALKSIIEAVTAAIEAETVQVIAAVQSQVVAIATATETDTAQALPALKPITAPVTTATEAEAAEGVAPAKTAPVADATETEAGSPLAPAKTTAMAAVTETEQATAVAVIQPQVVTVGAGIEAEAGQTITPTADRIISLGPAGETEQAATVAAVKPVTVALLPAVETETPRDVTPVTDRLIALGAGAESELAVSISAIKPITEPLASATESELASTISAIKPIVESLGASIEVETLGGLVAVKAIAVGDAVELEAASGVPVVKPIIVNLGPGLETETAQAIGAGLAAILSHRASLAGRKLDSVLVAVSPDPSLQGSKPDPSLQGDT